MNSHSRFKSCCTLAALGLGILFACAVVDGQSCPDNPGVRTFCKQIGDAEVVSVSGPFSAYPSTPPTVYWHDQDWWIDVLPKLAEDGKIRVQIKPRDGGAKIVEFDEVLFAQVDSITRNAEGKAIVLGEPNGTSSAFSVLDLAAGKEIGGGLLYDPSISPNRRFLLYENWFPPHAESPQEHQFILYDTFKSPEMNICGYESDNPEYRKHRDELNGIQVYPYQTSCLVGNNEDDDNRAITRFLWSSDSSKVVFADIKSGAISLILVTMPTDKDDHPRTSIYTFTGANDVCAGAATCDNYNVKSVAWNNNSINVALIQANPGGKAIEKDLTIPLSSFVPIGSDAPHSSSDDQNKPQ